MLNGSVDIYIYYAVRLDQLFVKDNISEGVGLVSEMDHGEMLFSQN